MPVHSSTRSVYSTGSHLPSPRSSDRSSSPSLPRSSSAASSRSGTPLPPTGYRSSSIYPSSRLSDGSPFPLGASSNDGTNRKRPRNSSGDFTPSNYRQHPDSPFVSSERGRRLSRDFGTAFASPRFSRPCTTTRLVSPNGSASAAGSSIAVVPNRPDSHYGAPPLLEGFANLQFNTGMSLDLAEDERSISHRQDILSEIIMAIDMDKDGKVGCAYYSVIDEVLVLEEDIAMGGIDAVDTLLLQVQPTSVMIPNRAPSDLVEFLERNAHRYDDDEASRREQGSYILRNLVSAQFDYDAAKESLAKVDLEPLKPDPLHVVSSEEEPAQCIGSSSHNRLMRLAETINLDSCGSVGCAGAVLNDLERRRAVEDPVLDGNASTAFRVRSVKMNTFTDTMIVSADSLVSLQILQSELHPNPQSRSSNNSEPKAKETLSVSGLLQALACSAQGKRKLRQMLLRPSTNLNLIQERQKTIEVLRRAKNHDCVKTMRMQLRKLKNTKTLLLNVRKGVDRIRGQLSIRTGDWKALLRFAMVSTQLRQGTRSLVGGSEVAICSRISNEVDERRFLFIGEIIMRTIDFQLSKESGRTEIFPGISQYLDELKREYSDACRMLPDLRDSVSRDIPRWAAEYILHCTIMPQIGFLIAVKLDPNTGEGVYHGQAHTEDEWTMCFVSGDVVYYKNRLMLDLDSQYGDLPSRIADEEIQVVMDLASAILQHEDAIISASELFGELDSLLALAQAADKYNWVAPTMTVSNVIAITEGRHPLQELLVPAFIPNDCNMAGGCGSDGPQGAELLVSGARRGADPSLLILTGPNNSGKSVYMKQVALIVYLAHTGSYVPATRATIGVTDRILTRIATRETVVNDESAFLVDLKQAAFSMNFATRRSLLLIDEFGKGTTAESGSALFAAYLTYFLDLGAERPKVLAGTHFHEVFENGFLKAGKDVGYAHMDTRLDPHAKDPEDQITFLYRLLPGRGPSSMGILCAAINGVPRDVISRAETIVALQNRNEDLVSACSESQSEEDRQRLAQAELTARRFLEMQVPVPSRGKQPEGRIRDMLQEILTLSKEEAGHP